VEEKDGVIHYNASSPDELALTNAARHFGIVFEERDEQNNIVLLNEKTGQREKFQLLNIIEFSSARKRMSVIVKTNDDQILCLVKGADSIVIPLLKEGQDDLIEKTLRDIDQYANLGLRTLLLAEKIIDPDVYLQWNKRYQEALVSTVNREEKVEAIGAEIENGFELVGCTAIEDKL
jgi:phospholipid-translocating ATPase